MDPNAPPASPPVGAMAGSGEEVTDMQLEHMEQQKLILQLKEMVRESQEAIRQKDKQVQVSILHRFKTLCGLPLPCK